MHLMILFVTLPYPISIAFDRIVLLCLFSHEFVRMQFSVYMSEGEASLARSQSESVNEKKINWNRQALQAGTLCFFFEIQAGTLCDFTRFYWTSNVLTEKLGRSPCASWPACMGLACCLSAWPCARLFYFYIFQKKIYRNIFWFLKFTVLYPYRPVEGRQAPCRAIGTSL